MGIPMISKFRVYVSICPYCKRIVKGFTKKQCEGVISTHIKYIHGIEKVDSINIIEIENTVNIPD